MDTRIIALEMALALALALVVASPLAAAHQVFKCVDGTQVSYQSEPCPGRATRAWDAKPQRFDPYKAARVEATRRQMARANAARRASGYRRYRSTQSRRSSANECATVRTQRDAAYARVGLHRTFQFSSDWDNRVQQACK